jgi:hypothetical protein
VQALEEVAHPGLVTSPLIEPAPTCVVMMDGRAQRPVPIAGLSYRLYV